MSSLIEKRNRYVLAIESIIELIENDNEYHLNPQLIYLKQQKKEIDKAISDENAVINEINVVEAQQV